MSPGKTRFRQKPRVRHTLGLVSSAWEVERGRGMLRILDWVACKVGLGTLRSGSGAIRVGPETLGVDSIRACPVYLA
jgi:hypothetical protein